MITVFRISIGFFVLFAVTAIADEKKPEKTGIVSGKVTLNGKAVPAGRITLHDAGGSMSSAIHADGTFQIKNVPIGEYRITVDNEPPAGLPGEPPPKRDPKQVDIPKKYGDIETSGLTATVVAGKQSLDIQLTK